jgi:hypothetical protein
MNILAATQMAGSLIDQTAAGKSTLSLMLGFGIAAATILLVSFLIVLPDNGIAALILLLTGICLGIL